MSKHTLNDIQFGIQTARKLFVATTSACADDDDLVMRGRSMENTTI